MRLRPSLAAVVGIVVVGAGVLVGTTPLDDNSFLTHLATGRLILDEGSVPSRDPFTFSAAGEPWVVQSWLATIWFALAERAAGPEGIILLRAALCAGLAALVWTLTRPALTLVPRLTLSVLVVVVGTNAWSERPLLVGLLGLCAVLLAAEGRLDPRWLVPIMWVWANCHGSFPLGLAALGALWAGSRLDRARSAVVEGRALLWAAGGTVMAAAGPIGPRVLLFPLDLLGNQTALQDVLEWQAPRFTSGDERAFLILLVLAVLALARRPSWRAALPLTLFTAAALVAARNVGPASIVVLPGAARGLAALGSLRGDERRPLFAPAVALLGALVTVVAVSRSAEGFDGAVYPVAAVSWLEDEGLLDEGARVVTFDYAGNYLEARFGPRRLVFMDDRYDMLPPGVLEDYDVLLGGEPGWAATLARLEPDAVVWRIDGPLGQLLLASEGWQVAYADTDWLVAVPPNR